MRLVLIILFYLCIAANLIYVIRKSKATPEETEEMRNILKEIHVRLSKR
jgi:hypothetical protein